MKRIIAISPPVPMIPTIESKLTMMPPTAMNTRATDEICPISGESVSAVPP